MCYSFSHFSDYLQLSKPSIFVFSELQPDLGRMDAISVYYLKNNILKGVKHSFCIVSVTNMYSKCDVQKVTSVMHCKCLDIKGYFFPLEKSSFITLKF